LALYYLDTSALVKRYVAEVGTAWVQALTLASSGSIIATSRLAGPEMISALTRKAHAGGISVADAARAVTQFRRYWELRFQVVEVDRAVALLAMDLADRHGLRGYDAVHLAAALYLDVRSRAAGLPGPIFISADTQQLQAVQAEGLATDDPNLHP
jgi:uncharacterized protein